MYAPPSPSAAASSMVLFLLFLLFSCFILDAHSYAGQGKCPSSFMDTHLGGSPKPAGMKIR